MTTFKATRITYWLYTGKRGMAVWEIPVQDVPPMNPLDINPFSPIEKQQSVVIDPDLHPELQAAIAMAANEQFQTDEVVLKQYETKEEAEAAYRVRAAEYDQFVRAHFKRRIDAGDVIHPQS